VPALAELLGVSDMAVYRWETKKAVPQPPLQVKLLSLMTQGDLFTAPPRKPTPPPPPAAVEEPKKEAKVSAVLKRKATRIEEAEGTLDEAAVKAIFGLPADATLKLIGPDGKVIRFPIQVKAEWIEEEQR
jgi:transcriptional regulator with XRE-family HTH domain